MTHSNITFHVDRDFPPEVAGRKIHLNGEVTIILRDEQIFLQKSKNVCGE